MKKVSQEVKMATAKRGRDKYRNLHRATGLCLNCSSPKHPTSVYCHKHRAEMHERQMAKRRRDRQTVIAYYGGRCLCCSEPNYSFLTIDHVGNDGSKHRDENNGHVYADIIRKGFPADYRVLCYNCNCARQFSNNGGDCPHGDVDAWAYVGAC